MINVIKKLCPQNHRCPLIDLCPEKAITQDGNKAPTVDHEKCIECNVCVSACAYGAFEKK